MKILVLGGTGSIGSAVASQLKKHSHHVIALSRSAQSRIELERMGVETVHGDITTPSKWVDVVDTVDGVIHAAAVWGDEMGHIDEHLVDVLLDRLQSGPQLKSFVYTGGCWLYGDTGDQVATEKSKFNSLSSFSWSIPIIEKVLTTKNVKGMVIHPAMVYDRNGGVFDHIFEDAKNLGVVRVIESETIKWPLIHREDLAQLYTLLIENGKSGDVYNAATNHGVAIGEITRVIAKRLGIQSDPVIVDTKTAIREIGSWAEGYSIDQQMSGEKAREQLRWQPKYEDVFTVIS